MGSVGWEGSPLCQGLEEGGAVRQAQPVQRPRGTMAPTCWRPVRRGGRNRARGGGGGDGDGSTGLCRCQDNLGSYSREVAALEGCGQQRGWDPTGGLAGALWWLLWGHRWGRGRYGRDTMGWTQELARWGHIREIFAGQNQHGLADGPALGEGHAHTKPALRA